MHGHPWWSLPSPSPVGSFTLRCRVIYLNTFSLLLLPCCYAGEDSYLVTDRTKVKRKPGRGVYDRETVHAILDEAFLCHVGIVQDDQPIVIPTAYARVGEKLYLHGHAANHLLKTMKVHMLLATAG